MAADERPADFTLTLKQPARWVINLRWREGESAWRRAKDLYAYVPVERVRFEYIESPTNRFNLKTDWDVVFNAPRFAPLSFVKHALMHDRPIAYYNETGVVFSPAAARDFLIQLDELEERGIK